MKVLAFWSRMCRAGTRKNIKGTVKYDTQVSVLSSTYIAYLAFTDGSKAVLSHFRRRWSYFITISCKNILLENEWKTICWGQLNGSRTVWKQQQTHVNLAHKPCQADSRVFNELSFVSVIHRLEHTGNVHSGHCYGSCQGCVFLNVIVIVYEDCHLDRAFTRSAGSYLSLEQTQVAATSKEGLILIMHRWQDCQRVDFTGISGHYS